MSSSTKLLPLTRALATVASILGILIGVMAPVTSLSMGVPIFTGQRPRDVIMLAFMVLPALQVASVVAAAMREHAHPRFAVKLYGLTLVLFGVLFAIPALG